MIEKMNKNKLCIRCKKKKREGLSYCKICLSLKNRNYYFNNREKRLKDIKERQKITNYKSDKKPLRRIKNKIRAKARIYLKIPLNKLCEICKKEYATERHHEDYNKPLEVIFLCRSCHNNLHNKYSLR